MKWVWKVHASLKTSVIGCACEFLANWHAGNEIHYQCAPERKNIQKSSEMWGKDRKGPFCINIFKLTCR